MNQNLKAQEDEKGRKDDKNISESDGSEDGKEEQEDNHPLLGDRKRWASRASDLVVPLAQLSMQDSLSGTDRKYCLVMILVNQFAMCNGCFLSSTLLLLLSFCYHLCLICF